MTSSNIILDGKYIRLGRLEFFLDRCSYQPARGDKRLEVTRKPRTVNIMLFTWHLCICHPAL